MRRELGMFIALAVLVGALALSNEKFYGADNVNNVARQIAMLAILAIGSSFVIVTGGIDLSAGSIVGLTGVIVAYYASPASPRPNHLSIGWGITIAMAVALFIGLVQGLLITRLNLQPFIVTLAGMLTIRGISQTVVEGGNISFGSEAPFLNLANLGYFMKDDIPRLPYLIVICVVVVLVTGYLLHFTVFGRYLYAIGGNRDAAQYSGIPVKRVETISYVISAGLAGVAGVCYASYIGEMSHAVGVAYELNAIAACVLGGFSLRGGEGTVIGVVIGTGMFQIIENGFQMFQLKRLDANGAVDYWRPNENWRNIVIGLVILLAVILDQVFHIVQQRRRTKSAGSAAKAPPGTTVSSEAAAPASAS